MKIQAKAEKLTHGKHYVVRFADTCIASGRTANDAETSAVQVLADAYNYATRACVARLAVDGTIVVFRQTSDTDAMYEYCRNGSASHGCCMGRMSDGVKMYRNLSEYADHVMQSYNMAVSPMVA